jgi:hypothetical protein
VDNVREQKKLKATKMPENAPTPSRPLHAALGGFLYYRCICNFIGPLDD